MSVALLQADERCPSPDWRVRALYRQLEYPRFGWAWEFLRRNLTYREEFAIEGLRKLASEADATADMRWPVIEMESPHLGFAQAKVFWRPEMCPAVLPLAVAGGPLDSLATPFTLHDLRCDVSVLSEGDIQHILLTQEGRTLQLFVQGGAVADGVVLQTTATLANGLSPSRIAALKRLNDLLVFRELRPQLYPSDKRARRLAIILQALDGALAGAHHREIAAAIFGEERVAREWNYSDHLRDQVRRAISQGRALSRHGYLRFLL